MTNFHNVWGSQKQREGDGQAGWNSWKREESGDSESGGYSEATREEEVEDAQLWSGE